MKILDIKKSINNHLSGFSCTDENIQYVLKKTKGEPIMTKKLTLVPILTMIFLLIIGVAIAASLGVFGQFSNQENDERLESIEKASATLPLERYIIDSANGFPESEFTICQHYYDGQSLYLSYTLTDSTLPVTFLDTSEATDIIWDSSPNEYGDGVAYFDDVLSATDIEMIGKKLDEEGTVLFEAKNQAVGSATVVNGPVLQLNRMNLRKLPDGTLIGYMEFTYPLPTEAQDKDKLDLMVTLTRSSFQYYQDDTGGYSRNLADQQQQIELICSILPTSTAQSYRGEIISSEYAVDIALSLSDVDIKADIVVNASADWVKGWKDSFYRDQITDDIIIGFNLYANDVICNTFGSNLWTDKNMLRMSAAYKYPEKVEKLEIVPVYNLSGERRDERVVCFEIDSHQ